MPITHIRPGRASTSTHAQRNKHSLTTTLATLATIATVAAIALSLLGYGVAIAVENTFIVPHAQVFSSSADLLSLSIWAILEIFNQSLWDLIAPLLDTMAISALLLSVLMTACWVFLSRKDFWPNARWWQLRKRRGPEKRRRFLMWMTPVAGLFGAGSVYLVYGFLVAALFVALTIIGTLPAIGMTTGKHSLEKNVVMPQRCATIRSRDSLIKKYETERQASTKSQKAEVEIGATCVQVLHDGKLVAKGRVAISTTAYLVLFDPVSGQVLRVPTHDSIVEPISSL